MTSNYESWLCFQIFFPEMPKPQANERSAPAEIYVLHLDQGCVFTSFEMVDPILTSVLDIQRQIESSCQSHFVASKELRKLFLRQFCVDINSKHLVAIMSWVFVLSTQNQFPIVFLSRRKSWDERCSNRTGESASEAMLRTECRSEEFFDMQTDSQFKKDSTYLINRQTKNNFSTLHSALCAIFQQYDSLHQLQINNHKC